MPKVTVYKVACWTNSGETKVEINIYMYVGMYYSYNISRYYNSGLYIWQSLMCKLLF